MSGYVLSIADKEVRGGASSRDQQWLRTNKWTLAWWLMALQCGQDNLESEIKVHVESVKRTKNTPEFSRRLQNHVKWMGEVTPKLDKLKARIRYVRPILAQVDRELSRKKPSDMLQYLLKNRKEWEDVVKLEAKMKKWAREHYGISL